MTPTIAPPSTPAWGRLLDAAQEIAAALYDQGTMPRWHQWIEARHRRQWPALWETVDELMRSIDALHDEAEGVERSRTPLPAKREREALARITDQTNERTTQ